MGSKLSTIRLNDIATLYDSLHKTPKYAEDGYPMVRVTDIKRGYLDLSQAKKVDIVTYQEFTKKYKPRIGDIVFSRVGSYGNSSYVNKYENFCLGQNTVCIAPKPQLIDSFYLYAYLNSPFAKSQIESLVGGASQPTISLQNIGTLQIPYPNLAIQKRVSGVLKAYDDLIENNTKRIKILEEMAQLLYREWFVNFRFPGHQQVPLVESELGLIPQSWLISTIDDVCTRVTDGSHGSPKSVEQGYPMASVKDMRTWGLDIESCRKISKEDYEKLVSWDCRPLKGDILIAKDGNTYLKHMFVIEKELDVVVLSSIAILRPNNRILPHILTFYLLEPKVKSRLSNYVSGAAIPRIILKDFKRFPVVVPEIAIQEKFYWYVEPMIKQIHCLLEKNVKLRKTRDLLLPKLISGEIDVESLDSAIETDLEELAA